MRLVLVLAVALGLTSACDDAAPSADAGVTDAAPVDGADRPDGAIHECGAPPDAGVLCPLACAEDGPGPSPACCEAHPEEGCLVCAPSDDAGLAWHETAIDCFGL